MSITFTFASVERGPDGQLVTRFGSGCDHTGFICRAPGCEDWQVYRYCDHAARSVELCGCLRFDVQVSNSNAALVLGRLDLPCGPDDLVGTCDADDFLGRALVANIGLTDDGCKPAATSMFGATVIDCGIRPGYFNRQMRRLVDLAVEAKRRGVQVGWW